MTSTPRSVSSRCVDHVVSTIACTLTLHRASIIESDELPLKQPSGKEKALAPQDRATLHSQTCVRACGGREDQGGCGAGGRGDIRPLHQGESSHIARVYFREVAELPSGQIWNETWSRMWNDLSDDAKKKWIALCQKFNEVGPDDEYKPE